MTEQNKILQYIVENNYTLLEWDIGTEEDPFLQILLTRDNLGFSVEIHFDNIDITLDNFKLKLKSNGFYV